MVRKLNIGNFILDVRDKMAGVEMSSAVRSRITSDILGHNTYFFTTIYNKDLAQNVQDYTGADRFSKKSQVINIYDYYQKSIEKHKPVKIDNFKFRVVQVENSKDYRGYDSVGNFAAYFCMRPTDITKINFINYLKEGKPFRRDQYSSSGALSRTELLNIKNELVTEIYYDVHTNPVIIKQYEIADQKSKLVNIQLNDERGTLLKSFESEQEFLQNWFNEIIGEYKIDVALVDRVLEFYAPLRWVKENCFPGLQVVPVVHSSHTKGDPMAAELTKFYDQPMQKTARQDGMIVLTDRQKVDIDARFGQSSIFVLPHAHNIKAKRRIKLKPLLQKKIPKKIVHVARFSPEKRHLKAIDIYETVVKSIPNVQVELYGFGATRTDIEEKIQKKGLGKNIKICGFSDDVNDVFINADVSVMTSSVEGFCLAIQESLANGCPVVSFDIKYGPAEMIVDGQNGALIPEGRDKMMANKLISILQDDEMLENMSTHALRLSEQFSENQLASRWKDMFSALLREAH
jgi:poly(glycerol-phosphate) alpha-glucosyltransferase